MPNPGFEDEELKRRARDVYELDGLAAAHRETGIPRGTIGSWAYREGWQTVANENMQAAIEAAKLRRDEMREQLSFALIEEALSCVEDMGALHVIGLDKNEQPVKGKLPAKDRRELAIAAGVLIDKMRLEAGEVTSRDEVSVRDRAAEILAKARARRAEQQAADQGDGAGGEAAGEATDG